MGAGTHLALGGSRHGDRLTTGETVLRQSGIDLLVAFPARFLLWFRPSISRLTWG
jgi:hypothetical protein